MMKVFIFAPILLAATCLCSTHASKLKERSFVTYNVGLEDSLPNRDGRREKIISKLRTHATDGVCLQNVWYSSDLEKIVTDLKDIYPYSLSILHKRNGRLGNIATDTPPCSLTRFNVYKQCVLQSCIAVISNLYDLYECVLTSCTQEFMSMSQQCRICLLLSPNALTTEYCVDEGIKNKTVNVLSTLYLSKRKITSGKVHVFDGNLEQQITPKGVLSMTVKGVPGRVVCTCLLANSSAIIPYIEPNLPQYTSFEEQNLGQVRQLLERYNSTYKLIVMGHFNAGPAIPRKDIASENIQSYRALREAFPMRNSKINRKCTLCRDNPLAAARGVVVNKIVDQFFVRNHCVGQQQRIFDDSEVPLSDHYGIKATVVV